MNKRLIRQMLNEWRTNLWLLLEFLVVSVVIWYITDGFYVMHLYRSTPTGFNSDNCYLLTLYEVTDKSPEYLPDRSKEERMADMYEILSRLQRRPEVEAASYSNASYPYNGSNSTLNLRDDTLWANGLRRVATPDFVRVFRYEGKNGETSEELAKMLSENKILVVDHFFTSSYGDKGRTITAIGEGPLYSSDGDDYPLTVGAALKPVRYSDYNLWDVSSLVPIVGEDDWILNCSELCIRVRPEMDHNIKEKLMSEAQSQFHVGNFTLTDVKSFDDIRRDFQRSDTNEERNRAACMVFLLVNVFLGMLGTFWFRTQQRVKEVGLRKVNGARDHMVFGRLIAEGLILLTAATIPALAVYWLLTHLEYNMWFWGYFSTGRWLMCALITYVIMAVMVAAGIWMPARRAMKVDPARALADE